MKRALFLAPEPPTLGGGGGGMRSASLLEYLRGKYEVDVVTFDLKIHSKSFVAKAARNGLRLLRDAPPLFDRFSGYERQIAAQLKGPYHAAVVEHFWCAGYADLLRPYCGRLILDLHNIESGLARTHARAATGPASFLSARFARAYESLEKTWLPKFDALLVASPDDLRRVNHANAHVFPNAIPVIARPSVSPLDALIFTGNLEYHPNVEAVRWFKERVWPLVRGKNPTVEWRLAGVNPRAVQHIVAGDPRIRLIGPVVDAIGTIAQAKIAIVPLLSGSGTRFKILEAWAAERLVISTSIGAEGLGAVRGQHLLIADTAGDFAAEVLNSLDDSSKTQKIAEAGREHYLRNFTWPVAWRALESSGVI